MSLVRDALSNSLRSFFDPKTMPKGGVSETVRQWVTAYAAYGQAAIAGGTLPSPLVPGGADGRFDVALDQALRTMWMGVAWTGPALVGVTLLVPPLVPALEAVGATLLTSRDPAQALSLITDALHTYTLSITVTVTPAAGTPVVVPLT